MKVTASIEEANGFLQDAITQMEAQDSVIQSLPSDCPDERREFEKALFEARKKEVAECRETLERLIALDEAKRKTPLPTETPDDDDPPDQDRVRITRGRAANDLIRVGREPLVYERGNGQSFFRDLAVFQGVQGLSARPGWEGRITKHRDQMRVETGRGEARALNSTDGQGGYLVAPLWLMDEFVQIARAARPWADSARQLPLPPNTDSINIPQGSTGTTVATQQDGGTVSSTDYADTALTVPVITVAGNQDMSRQLFDRALPGIDQVIVGDLAAAYATQIDVQCLSGGGSGGAAKGVLSASGTNSVTYTAATPTLSGLYSKLADAVQQIHTGRFLPPTGIFMHPRRWGWCLSQLDTSNRPLITPYAPYNAMADTGAPASQGPVGNMMGLPVYTSASIPTNLGNPGTNEDAIIVSRLQENYLWEEGNTPHEATYFEVLSANLQVRVQVWGYLAYTAERYPKATSVIEGTGLATPSF